MKKIILMAFLAIICNYGVKAQTFDNTRTTKQIIETIPSLSAIQTEIHEFESKTEGRKEEYKHAGEDLKALKQKYISELNIQISARKDDKEVVSALNEELEKTKRELANLK